MQVRTTASDIDEDAGVTLPLTRRRFLGAAIAAGAAFVPRHRARAANTFRLAMAGCTFNKFKLEPTLEALKRVNVHYLCIKDFHLPLNSTDAEIAASTPFTESPAPLAMAAGGGIPSPASRLSANKICRQRTAYPRQGPGVREFHRLLPKSLRNSATSLGCQSDTGSGRPPHYSLDKSISPW